MHTFTVLHITHMPGFNMLTLLFQNASHCLPAVPSADGGCLYPLLSLQSACTDQAFPARHMARFHTLRENFVLPITSYTMFAAASHVTVCCLPPLFCIDTSLCYIVDKHMWRY